MFPDLFSIGPLTLHTYGLFVAMGFVAGVLVAVYVGRSHGLSAQQVMDMGFVMILSGLVGSRLVYVLINLDYYVERPLDMVKVWEGGLVFSGGIAAVLAAVVWYGKRHGISLWTIGDTWAPAAALGQGIGRIGCFMAGCCYGRPTDLPWGAVFSHPHSLAPVDIPLHPTQIYSSIAGFVIFFILMILHSRRKFQGQVFLWYLILHSVARLAVERFRGDDRGVFLLGGGVTVTQAITVLILTAAVTALVVLKDRNRKDAGEGS